MVIQTLNVSSNVPLHILNSLFIVILIDNKEVKSVILLISQILGLINKLSDLTDLFVNFKFKSADTANEITSSLLNDVLSVMFLLEYQDSWIELIHSLAKVTDWEVELIRSWLNGLNLEREVADELGEAFNFDLVGGSNLAKIDGVLSSTEDSDLLSEANNSLVKVSSITADLDLDSVESSTNFLVNICGDREDFCCEEISEDFFVINFRLANLSIYVLLDLNIESGVEITNSNLKVGESLTELVNLTKEGIVFAIVVDDKESSLWLIDGNVDLIAETTQFFVDVVLDLSELSIKDAIVNSDLALTDCTAKSVDIILDLRSKISVLILNEVDSGNKSIQIALDNKALKVNLEATGEIIVGILNSVDSINKNVVLGNQLLI